MLNSVFRALETYEPTISSIVGLLTLFAAIWGILRLSITARRTSESTDSRRGKHNNDRRKNRFSWGTLLNLGLSEHSQLEELVSIRTVNVVFFCLLALSLTWMLVSLISVKNAALTFLTLFVFVSSLLGLTLQQAGATSAARWLLILCTSFYWLGILVKLGPLQGTEYFLAGLLAAPILIFSRAQPMQVMFSVIFILSVFCVGVLISQSGPHLQVLSDEALYVAYNVNAIFLAAIIFAVVSYYKNFASNGYQLLASQKQQNDDLVSRLFPANIAKKMVNQESTDAQWHSEATVLYATLTGFTDLYSKLPAIELVTKLDSLYSSFDEIMLIRGVDKVKTLGTAYVAATGINGSESDHNGMAESSLALKKTVTDFAREHKLPIGFRCGIATGLTISGVIGKSRPRFDIWGEALEAAALIQSKAEEGQIIVNQTAYWRLEERFAFGSHPSDDSVFKLDCARKEDAIDT